MSEIPKAKSTKQSFKQYTDLDYNQEHTAWQQRVSKEKLNSFKKEYRGSQKEIRTVASTHNGVSPDKFTGLSFGTYPS